ncbi:hemicentin-1-like [Anguilla anguilla]|uniref:hemicentin-1-like n=1 Tax=Anguilla anguilla TaxID=7936 RepID=UPI0015ACE726|nr:hemicentin-1-like [Anguilla anguilla]
MGSFRRSSVLCSVIQGLAVWSVAAAGQPWSVTIPNQMSAPVGSCIVVPCSFTPPTANEAVEVTWYQYVNRGYPLVYSESKPGDVIDKFRDSTELIGRAGKGNCSLKINPTREAHNAEKIYVWIEPNQLDGYFYDQTVTLEVTENAPQPEIRVLRSDLTEGDVVRLSCDVIHTCPPSPPSVSFRNHRGVLSWSHNEQEAGRWRVSVETSWKVNSVDHGRGVTCDVTHPGGRTARREIVLRVTYPPKSVSVHGPPNALPPGGSVSLSCSSQANPPATSFQWYRVDQGQPKLLEVSSKDIRVMKLDRDQNLYRCKASNSVGSGSSPDFEVIKEYQPSISEASGCSFYAGAVSCWCEATARPSASLRWRVDGVTQAASPARPSTTSVHTVRGEWAGKAATEQVSVTCVSSNRHGQKERLLRVYVKAPLSNVMVTQHPSHPREGEGVTLSCTGQGYPPASGYRWYLGRDGQEIGLAEESSELSVRPVARDSGPYRCTARNQIGESSSPVTSVNVEYQPSISEASGCSFYAGAVSCWCEATARPSASLQWRVDGVTQEASPARPSTTSVHTVRGEWVGKAATEQVSVTCVSSNRHGQKERLLRVYVKAPLSNVMVTQHPSRPREGEGVTLSCTGQGYPPASGYRWYLGRDGQEIRLAEESSELLVRPVARDSGPYRCTARNQIGESSSPVTSVNVEYQPSVSEASGCSFYAGAVSCWCEATARPSASLRWRVDGVTQEASPARPSTTSVHTVRGEWVGKAATEQVSVTCVSSNQHGQKERLLRVYVKAPLSNVMVTQHPSRPREGAGVTLSCTGQGYPPASGYRWYLGRDGQEFGLEEESSELSVRPVARDSGPYRCTARNQIGESSSPVTSVNVEYAPLILRNSSCTLGNGQWRCECIVDASPPAKVTWSSVGSSTNESGNTLSTLSGRVLRSVLTGPMGDGGHRFYCNATNEHGDDFYLLHITVEHFGKWGIVLGAIGGAVLICLLLGAFLYCKRTKRRPKHADLSLKEVKCAGEEEVKIDSLYSNIRACPPAHALPESMYEVEDAPRYQEMKRQPSYDDDVYQNY